MHASQIARFSWLVTLLVPLAIAGCTDRSYVTYAGWRQLAPRPQVQVSQVPVRHAVVFPAGASEFSMVEREAMQRFLARNGVRPGARVTLSAAGAPALVDPRLAAVRDELGRLGVTAMATSLGEAEPEADEIIVTAQVVAVLPPECPGYNAPIVFDFERRPIMNTGCANAANLGHHVVNPMDLVAGQPLAAADGEQTMPGIQRYRSGQVTPLDEETTTQ